MSIQTLLLYIGINAVVLSAVVIFLLKKSKSHWMTYLQTFCGALFLFSGWVKAVDPLGTAYKMEQYFDEFYYTFEATSFGFLAPLFPLLSEYSIAFSVVMIIFELILGFNLLTGAWPKWTAWAFFLLTVFFTILTGFTYLTGYVPSGGNFFAFGDWGLYDENNMRVTDCGCFGDFIKLKPKVSFLKDIFLLIPATLFILFHGKFFQLFSPGIRRVLVGVFGVITLIYSMSNYVWDIPHVDFRDFKAGTDVAAKYSAEQEASGSVRIKAWKIKNPNDGQVVEISNDVFMSEWGTKYKPKGWEVIDQVKTAPSIPITKISDFEFTNADGFSASEELLQKKGVTAMWVSYHLKGNFISKTELVPDTTFVLDTVFAENQDTFELVQRVQSIGEKEIESGSYKWSNDFADDYQKLVVPLSTELKSRGADILGLAGGAGSDKIEAFRSDLGLTFPVYEADEILLKTIVRSNPGLVLWKDGVILKKWHISKLPTASEIENYWKKKG